MLETTAFVMVALWLLGLATATAPGGHIHVLLAVAIVLLLIRTVHGRRFQPEDSK